MLTISAFLRRHMYLWSALGFVTIFLLSSYIFISAETLGTLSEEGKWIENVSVVVLLQTFVLALYTGYKTKTRGWYLLGYLALAAAFRELGMHKSFTSDSILKSRFYLTPEFPLWEKILGIVFILSLIVSFIILVRKFIPSLKALWQGVLHVQAIYVCLGLYTIAKSLDSFVRLFPFWSQVQLEYDIYMRYAEESMEMFGAISLLLAVQFFFLSMIKTEGEPASTSTIV